MKTLKKLLALFVTLAILISGFVACNQNGKNEESATDNASEISSSDPEGATTAADETTPNVTTAPNVTSAPDVTTGPDVTTIPEATTAPEVSTSPEATTSPESTTSPEETTAPEVTTAEPTVVTDPPHTHSYSSAWSKSATQHWHECSCGALSDIASHNFSDWTVTKSATETAAGEKYRTCSVCGYRETAVIPELNHTHSFASTWGYDETGHWHPCVCGEKFGTTNHTYGEWVVVIEATCVAVGSIKRTCSVCGFVETARVEKTAHTVVSDPAISPTCTVTGKTEGSHCSYCGAIVVKQNPIPATGHNFSTAWSSDGVNHWHECHCGERSENEGHMFGEWQVSREPTCSAEGLSQRFCSVCSYAESKSIEKTPHTPVIDPAQPATCTIAGKTEGSHCSVCGTIIKEQILIPAKGHVVNNDVCLVCGKTIPPAWDGISSTPFEGEGTAENPYIIASAENLKSLQKQVDDANNFEGSYFTQTADIDLGGKEWTPIGSSSKPFSGVYDGLGHEITGLYITKEDTNTIGLFGYITSGYQGQAGIMNLEVSGEFIFRELTKDTGLGGVVGWVYKDGSDGFKRTQLINITSNVNIAVKATTRQPRLGAVFGYVFDSDVTNVINNGNIDYKGSTNSRVGGITGQTNRTTYTGCVNNGNIKVEMTNPNETINVSAHVGGICGYTTYKIIDLYTVYDGCINNGSIDVSVQTGKIYVAGIAGATYSSGFDIYLDIKNCLNTGTIKGEQKDLTIINAPAYVGGISAKVGNGYASVVDCVNTNTDIISICGIGDYSGGIVSMFENKTNVLIKNCLAISDRISTAEPKLDEAKAPEENCQINVSSDLIQFRANEITESIKPISAATINGFISELHY